MSALLYAALGSLVLLVAARVTRMSRGAAAALVLFPLVFTGRALFTGAVYGPLDLAYTTEPMASVADRAGVGAVANPSISDVYAQFFPWKDAMRRSIRAGEWPLWNPYELSGAPLAGAAQVAPYHPITLASLVLPIAGSFAFAAAMLYLFAAVSAFLLLRDLTDSESAALFGAAAWMASTHLIFFAGTALANGVSVAPLVLLGARRIVHEPGQRSTAILGIALLLVVLSGHPETALHVVALAVAYFVYSAVSSRDRLKLGATIGSGLGAGFGALLLCAFFLLPHLDAIGQSEEYEHRNIGYRQRSAGPELIAHRVIANVFPFLEGASGVEEPLHAPEVRHGWMATAYAGSLLFPAVLLGFRRARERGFWIGVLIWGFGAGLAVPGFTHVLDALPGFSIAVNDRMIVFATLAMAVLAAQGIAERRSVVPFLAVFGVVLAAAVLLPSGVGTDYRFAGAVRAIVPLLLAAGVLLVVPPRFVVGALTALLLLQRASEGSWMQPTVPAKAFYPPFPGLELMKSDAPFRIVATGNMLPPALSTHYGLEDARGFQAVTLLRYEQTYPLWSKRQAVWSNRIDDLNSPLLSAMNVRYAIVSPELTLPSWWKRIGSFGAYDIAENDAVIPRAWVPHTVHYTGLPAETRRVMSGIHDFAEESTVQNGHSKYEVVANGPGSVSLEGSGSKWRVRAQMEQPGWVIVSNAAWKGWHARSGGRELPIRFGNHAFIAFRLPAGTHDVELTYLPRSFVTGSIISAVTALLIAIAYTGIPSSIMTFFMSLQTSFLAAGVRRR